MFLCIGIVIFIYCLNKRKPNPILFESHYVAHGQYLNDSLAPNSMPLFKYLVEEKGYKILEVDVLFTSDNVPVLCHDWNINNIAVDSFGCPADVVVERTTYNTLCEYNFAKNPSSGEWHKIDLFKDIIKYAKQNDVCLQIDIQKWIFSREQCRQLYDIVSDAEMLNSVIWELSDYNLKTFMQFDPYLIYQLDEKWTHEELDKYRPLKYWSSLVIFSNQLRDISNLDFSDIIDHGHRNGYLMKNSVINNSAVADSLFRQGTDLIVTGDEL